MGSIEFYRNRFLEGLGLRVHPLEHRFSDVVKRLERWPGWESTAKEPYIMLGSARTGHEVMLFQRQLLKVAAPVAILVTPSEITGAFETDNLRPQHFWVDSSMAGDVLGGSWNVFVCTRLPLKLTMGPNLLTQGITLASRYESIGKPSAPDPDGRRVNYDARTR